jgi:hypothetical protein
MAHNVPLHLSQEDVQLLKACVGFHAKQQTDPTIRERLYHVWCELDTAAARLIATDSRPTASGPVGS